MKSLSLILMLTIVLAQDCKTRKNTESLPEMTSTEVMPVIKLMKNPCFGKCPMFSLTISNDGTAEYVGRDHVEKMGTFTKNIGTEKVALLLQRFNAINFWEMEDRYNSDLSDTQKVIISRFRKDTSKVVSGDHARPESLRNIEKMLTKIADSPDGWTKIKDHPAEQKKMPNHFIKNEIIAKFAKGTDVEAVVATKKDSGLSIKKRVAPKLDMWVLTFDTMQVNPAIMLIQVKKLDGVEMAEFNKQLTPREH